VADFATQADTVRRALADEGRDAARFAIAKRVYVAVEDDEELARRRLGGIIDAMYGASGLGERVAVGGPPERIAAVVRELATAGAQEVALTPMYAHLAQLEAL